MKKLILLFFACFLILSLGCALPSQEAVNSGEEQEVKREVLEPSEIASLAFPSTVMLTMEDENHQPLSLGSGFFVSPNHIVTNHHVIEEAYGGFMQIIEHDEKHPIEGIVALDSYHDLALLKVGGVDGVPINISDKDIDVGDRIYAIGNPLGLKGTLSDGIVSGLRVFGNENILQISAPISPGSSGGPIINNRGELVGVAVATLRDGQNLNFAIPSQYVQSLMDNAEEVAPFKEIPVSTTNFLEELESQKPTDGLTVSNFLWDDSHGRFTFSIINNLGESVDQAVILLIFYDEGGNPLDIYLHQPSTWDSETIPGGLAKRFNGRVEQSTQKLTTRKKNAWSYEDQPYTKLEIRVLDYRILR